MSNTEQKARELIESFYKCMPFRDVKLTSCDEKPELIIQMEKLSAKQCAIIAVDEILDYKFEYLPYGTCQVLLKHHFDLFGLIEKGLAVDINTLSVE